MRYEVIGPKGVILASGLTKRQADTYCANCGGSVRAENPAPRKAANSTGYGVVTARRLPFLVEVESPAGWGPLADFTSESEAVKYARVYNAQSNVRVRVIARGRKG
jgi:hypothetical protein